MALRNGDTAAVLRAEIAAQEAAAEEDRQRCNKRRDQVLGDVLCAGHYRLPDGFLRQCVDGTGDENLFGPDLLRLDGWKLSDDGNWSGLPAYPAAPDRPGAPMDEPQPVSGAGERAPSAAEVRQAKDDCTAWLTYIDSLGGPEEWRARQANRAVVLGAACRREFGVKAPASMREGLRDCIADPDDRALFNDDAIVLDRWGE